MISITVGNGRDIRSQIPQQFHAQYDALAATGMSQHMLAAAMAELTSVKIAVPRSPAAEGGSDKPADDDPDEFRRSLSPGQREAFDRLVKRLRASEKQQADDKKKASPESRAVAQRRAANDLSRMSVASCKLTRQFSGASKRTTGVSSTSLSRSRRINSPRG
jgi:hypothetical protein